MGDSADPAVVVRDAAAVADRLRGGRAALGAAGPGGTQGVQNFLAAVVDGRSGDAASVLSPEATATGVGKNWLEDPPPLSDIRVGDERPDAMSGTINPDYTDVTFVPVTFYLDDFSADQGFPGGETGWGYVVANTPDDGWLILSNGMV